MRIAWLGLGAMGAPMAACAAVAGHEVVAFDIDPARVAAVPGVRGADSPAAAGERADVAAVMVATASQVEDVLFGRSGAAATLPQGAVVLVMATVGPEAVVDWAGRLRPQGLQLVDAPVSGGVARAAAGDLLVMASGAPSAVAVVAPLLATLAREAPVVGPAPGDGQRVKLVNQLLCGVHIAAAAEALAYAEALGLDAAACWNVLRHGAAASFMLTDRGERMLADERQVRSAVDIFVKDMGLVVDAATAHGASAPLAAVARQLYDEASAAGRGRDDDSAVIDVLRDRRLGRADR